MQRGTFGKLLTTAMAAILTLSIIGCGSKYDGTTYVDQDGAMTLDFKGGQATITVMNEGKTGKYTVDGDKITVAIGSDSFIFTHNSDGSLTGPMGTKLTKK